MAITLTDFETANKEYLRLLKQKENLDRKVKELKEQRDDLCPHNNTSPKKEHYSGDYYNTAYTNVWEECEDCGAKSEVIRLGSKHYG